MSSTKCVYHGCDNVSRDIAMFRFPVNDQERLLTWMKNTGGNIFLNSLTNKELRCRYICAAHFPPSMIHHGKRSRLIGPAVPVCFQSYASEDKNTTDTFTMKIDESVPGPWRKSLKTRMDIESDVNIPYPGILELCGGGSPQTTKDVVLGDQKVEITETFTDDIENCKGNTCVGEFDEQSQEETYSCMETSSCDVIMCVGCLSVDRKCAPVGDNLELLIKLLCLSKDDEAPATSALLCWECAASLTRARRFIQRARRAQGELRRYASDPHGFVLEPQSNLSHVTKTDFDMTIVEAEVPQMDDERDDGTKDDDDDEAIADDISEMTDAKLEMDPRSMVQEINSLPSSYSHHMRVIPAEGRSGGGGRGGGGSGGGQGALACAPCDVAFTTPAELNKHRAQEHRDKDEAPYVCSICKDNFTKDELNAHMQQHMFVFYCEVCRRDFLTEKRFRVHYARGHAQIFECGYCRVPFATKPLLARHCLSLHYKYCCAHCGRQYMARDQLERHMRSHR